jgi:hypothetical protein
MKCVCTREAQSELSNCILRFRFVPASVHEPFAGGAVRNSRDLTRVYRIGPGDLIS